MIVFVGDESKASFASEVCKKRKIDISYIEENVDIKKQSNDILFLSKDKSIEFIIYDADQYINDATEIVSEIERISKAINAKVIICYPTDNKHSVFIRKCLDKDIKRFINMANDNLSRKDELEKNMTSFYDYNKREDIEEIKKIQEEEKLKIEKQVSIGIAGSIHRIGTTSLAFQILKYLNLKGYKPCYFEINENRYENRTLSRNNKEILSYVEKMSLMLDVQEENEKLGYIKYSDADIYYKQEYLNEVMKMDYDFIIFDYGCTRDSYFNKTAFLKDDISIVMCGSDISEFDYATEIASNISYEKAKLLFSFTSESEKDEIISIINSIKLSEKENAARCFFAEYTPSAFILTNKDILDKIFSIPEKNTIKQKKTFLERIKIKKCLNMKNT